MVVELTGVSEGATKNLLQPAQTVRLNTPNLRPQLYIPSVNSLEGSMRNNPRDPSNYSRTAMLRQYDTDADYATLDLNMKDDYYRRNEELPLIE
jgi:hypothetical protein